MKPQAQRILIVRTSALGDIVRAVPALVSLRRAYPDAQIDWLITDAFADAIRRHPDLSNVIPFPKRELKRSARQGHFSDVLQWASRTLTDARYDLAIDFQGLFRSGLLTFATRAPVRVGYADAREGAWAFYTDRVEVGGRSAHHVERVFGLLRGINVDPVPDLRIYPDEADRAALSDDRELAGKRYVLLSPTTKGFGRAWPMERYAELAKHLLDHRSKLGIDAVVVAGMSSERELCAPLLSLGREGLIDKVGRTSISSLMAMIERASLVVCNDSAAMHMTVAFNRPLVALFGPTDVSHAGPFQRPHDVITHKRPGEHVRHRDVARASEFMTRISAVEVIAACEARLAALNR